MEGGARFVPDYEFLIFLFLFLFYLISIHILSPFFLLLSSCFEPINQLESFRITDQEARNQGLGLG